jgi:hypothetical protein
MQNSHLKTTKKKRWGKIPRKKREFQERTKILVFV